ncbi:LrgB family protein [Fibrobacter succinogenes]|uniref:LrgB family protein n=1 Tax=Fibrobacter succinogenes TaxID=833 RepID=UPI001567F9B6|nr:LrgB family protein [Fibrobacter succinogenes]
MFGIILTIIAFEIGVTIRNKWRNPLLNPILIATILIIGFLTITGISYDTYKVGGDYISFFLGPVTVLLAVPLYRHIQALKNAWFPILAGIVVGSTVSIVCVIVCAKIFGISKTLMLSLIPKSITIPMGSVVSEQIGGIPSITIVSIVITGITGAVTAPLVCRFFRIKNPVAQGVAIGTSSHALGTTKAMEIGEVQGAMSSLSIGVAGVMTVFITPVLLKIFA